MEKINKLILAGGTGQIGKALIRFYKTQVNEIIIFTRGENKTLENIKYVHWNGITLTQHKALFENTDVLINLVGRNVNCRYNQKNKKEIFTSRTNSIIAIGEVIQQLEQKPKLWIQSASATIYRHSEDKEMTETNGEIGDGFSVDVCTTWENTFLKEINQFPEIRKAILRTSLVLSKKDGVYPRLRTMAKFGLGGRQGNGQQMVSWIHEDDLVRIIDLIIKREDLDGVFNCTAPTPLTNTLFMKELRKSLGLKIGLPASETIMKIGAFIISTEAELVLKSRWVIPERLNQAGFEFTFPTVDKAFENLKKP